MALPALLKRSTLPRISSPLATHSSSYSLSNESDTSSGSDDDDEGSDSESAGGSDSDDDDDEQVGRLKSLLQKAKDAARAREQPAEASEVVFDSDALKDTDTLPAVYTRHADPEQVFHNATASTSASIIASASGSAVSTNGKGKGRATEKDENDGSDILPGVLSKWGELPRPKQSKAAKAKQRERSAGKGWFDMPRRSATSLSNDEKREIQALRLSNVMDPKRFMRGESKRDNKKLPEFFQMGHVVEDASGPRAGLAAPSSKLKKQSFISTVLEDSKGLAWTKRRYADLQEKASSGGKNHYKRKMHDRKSSHAGGGKRKTRH